MNKPHILKSPVCHKNLVQCVNRSHYLNPTHFLAPFFQETAVFNFFAPGPDKVKSRFQICSFLDFFCMLWHCLTLLQFDEIPLNILF